MKRRVVIVALGALVCVAACQSYDFVFQPDTNREGVRLSFVVQQPSKADILFVVDNSGSMAEEQTALGSGIEGLLDALAPQDTSYRIGLTSTDMIAFDADCSGNAFPPQWGNSAQGPCGTASIQLRWPHDGARGRLIAAYDPAAFDSARYLGLLETQAKLDAFNTVKPKGVTDARWVIDRDQIQAESCNACGCQPNCSRDDFTCFDSCAKDVATALVTAYFRSNIAGLGIGGLGWEQGMHAAMKAVGIDPTRDTDALNPPEDYTKPGAFGWNTHTVAGKEGSWLRDEAVLGVLFLTDEEDCSMPPSLFNKRTDFEDNLGQPAGSMCYQPEAQAQMLDPERMSRLLTEKKTSASRVAIGLIGGAKQTGAAGSEDRSGAATDCVSTDRASVGADGQPSTTCACVTGPVCDVRWCEYTTNTANACAPGATILTCDAQAANRYVDFASRFARRTFDSVCRSDTCTVSGDCQSGASCINNVCTGGTCKTDSDCRGMGLRCNDGTCQGGYAKSLANFARIATEACFELEVKPADASGDNIVVKRASENEAAAGQKPVPLPQVASGSNEIGWFYEADQNRICLNGIDRTVGDVYEIFVLTTNEVDYTR